LFKRRTKLPTVLIADDNSKYLKDALPFYGYETKAAHDISHVFKVLEKEHIDIVILDVLMQNSEGWKILKTIRNTEAIKDIPIIILTAQNEDKSMIAGLKNGADDYIIKPFILPNLLARMEAVLRRTYRLGKNIIKQDVSNNELTIKEKEVLRLAAQGNSNKEIAEKLYVKEVTIKTHLNSVFKKLKVNNRTQAVLLAMQAELV